MTEPQAPSLIVPAQPPPPKPQPMRIVPAEGSPLAEMYAQRKALLAMLEDLKGQSDALTARIKGEVAAATNGYPVVDIAGPPGEPDLRLAHRQGRLTVNSKRLRAEQPGIWAQFAERGKDFWELRELGS